MHILNEEGKNKMLFGRKTQSRGRERKRRRRRRRKGVHCSSLSPLSAPFLYNAPHFLPRSFSSPRAAAASFSPGLYASLARANIFSSYFFFWLFFLSFLFSLDSNIRWKIFEFTFHAICQPTFAFVCSVISQCQRAFSISLAFNDSDISRGRRLMNWLFTFFFWL